MMLLNQFLDQTISKINENSFRIRFIGDLSAFEKKIKDKIEIIQNNSQSNSGIVITLALNYGGISDILNAFKELQNDGLELNEENFLAKTQLGNNNLDIFIRTGGDMRLSNFLLPNIGYSELFFTDKLWPEFTANDFEDVLKDFDERNRRFGK